MNKLVLILDTPQDCECCPCSLNDGYDYYCIATGKRVDWDKVSENCPLIPLPEPLECIPYARGYTKIQIGEMMANSYAKGYNDCLDKINGESNDLE